MEIKKINVVTKDYMYCGRHFYLISTMINGEVRYGSIEHTDVGEDGRLLRELNGAQMHLGRSIPEVIESVNRFVDYDRYIADGLSKGEAMARAFHLPLDLIGELDKICG